MGGELLQLSIFYSLYDMEIKPKRWQPATIPPLIDIFTIESYVLHFYGLFQQNGSLTILIFNPVNDNKRLSNTIIIFFMYQNLSVISYLLIILTTKLEKWSMSS